MICPRLPQLVFNTRLVTIFSLLRHNEKDDSSEPGGREASKTIFLGFRLDSKFGGAREVFGAVFSGFWLDSKSKPEKRKVR